MDDENQNTNRVTKSSSYKKALKKADDMAKNEEEALGYADKALERSSALKDSVGKLKDLFNHITLFVRLVRAFYKGEYRDISISSVIKVLSGIIYFVFVMDLIPDFIPFIGYLDDAALLTLIFGSVKNEIDKFAAWEEENKLQVNETA